MLTFIFWGCVAAIIYVTLKLLSLIRFYKKFNSFSKNSLTATLTWDLFQRMYEANPYGYEMDRNEFISKYYLYYIRRKIPGDEWYSYSYVFIKFKTIFDYFKACRYFNNSAEQQKKNKIHENEVKGLEALHKATQRDIEKLQKQADEEFKQAKQTTAAAGQSLNISTSPLRIIVDENGRYSIQQIDGAVVPLISQL